MAAVKNGTFPDDALTPGRAELALCLLRPQCPHLPRTRSTR